MCSTKYILKITLSVSHIVKQMCCWILFFLKNTLKTRSLRINKYSQQSLWFVFQNFLSNHENYAAGFSYWFGIHFHFQFILVFSFCLGKLKIYFIAFAFVPLYIWISFKNIWWSPPAHVLIFVFYLFLIKW